LGVDLDPVARAEHKRTCDVLCCVHVVQQLRLRVAGYHRPLESGDCRARVAETDDEKAHVPIASTAVTSCESALTCLRASSGVTSASAHGGGLPADRRWA